MTGNGGVTASGGSSDARCATDRAATAWTGAYAMTRARPIRSARRLSAASALAAAAVTLAGCVPNAVIPDVKTDVPAAYRYGSAGGLLKDHAVDWWVTFRSPELNRFMGETEVANYSIAAATAQVAQADAVARQQGSALFPSLIANNSVNRSGTGSFVAAAGRTDAVCRRSDAQGSLTLSRPPRPNSGPAHCEWSAVVGECARRTSSASLSSGQVHPNGRVRRACGGAETSTGSRSRCGERPGSSAGELLD